MGGKRHINTWLLQVTTARSRRSISFIGHCLHGWLVGREVTKTPRFVDKAFKLLKKGGARRGGARRGGGRRRRGREEGGGRGEGGGGREGRRGGARGRGRRDWGEYKREKIRK